MLHLVYPVLSQTRIEEADPLLLDSGVWSAGVSPQMLAEVKCRSQMSSIGLGSRPQDQTDAPSKPLTPTSCVPEYPVYACTARPALRDHAQVPCLSTLSCTLWSLSET
jgi:hypothetical protein